MEPNETSQRTQRFDAHRTKDDGMARVRRQVLRLIELLLAREGLEHGAAYEDATARDTARSLFHALELLGGVIPKKDADIDAMIDDATEGGTYATLRRMLLPESPEPSIPWRAAFAQLLLATSSETLSDAEQHLAEAFRSAQPTPTEPPEASPAVPPQDGTERPVDPDLAAVRCMALHLLDALIVEEVPKAREQRIATAPDRRACFTRLFRAVDEVDSFTGEVEKLAAPDPEEDALHPPSSVKQSLRSLFGVFAADTEQDARAHLSEALTRGGAAVLEGF